jgi:type IV pilus assembly protein PilA
MINLLSNKRNSDKEVKNMKAKKKKGFTLIELIVVIAILGILAAVAVPKISGFQDSARKSADIANAKMLNNAVQMYYADKQAYPAGTMAAANPTAVEVNSLVGVLDDEFLPAGTTIKFHTLSKLTFTIVGSTVTAVNYTP